MKMKTTIGKASRVIRQMAGIHIKRDEFGAPIVIEGIRQEEQLWKETRLEGFAEISRSGSIIGEIHPTAAGAENGRFERIRTQQEKHSKALLRNWLSLGSIYRIPVASMPTADWQDRRSAFNRN